MRVEVIASQSSVVFLRRSVVSTVYFLMCVVSDLDAANGPSHITYHVLVDSCDPWPVTLWSTAAAMGEKKQTGKFQRCAALELA